MSIELERSRAASYYDRGQISDITAQQAATAFGLELAVVGVGALVVMYLVYRAARPREMRRRT